MGNIHVKLYEIWASGLGDVILRKNLQTDGRKTDEDRSKFTLSLRLR